MINLTFTSFNPISFSQVETNTKNQPLSIKQGQVFHGTIKKLYPDQMAEVQIGNHKMMAKLEVPLKAGDSYFLQVKSVAPQVELSLVSNSTANLSPQEQLGQLMESMNLPKGSDAEQLVKFLMKNDSPIVKEQILQATNLMKNIPAGVEKQEVLVALQKMINDKLPMTQNVLNALIFGAKTSGMVENLEAFANALTQENNLPADMKANITNMLQKIATPFEGEVGGEILKEAIQTLQNSNANIGTRLHMLNLLKEAGVLPKEATLSNFQQVAFQQLAEGGTSGTQQAGQIVQMLRTANVENMEQTLATVKEWVQNQPLTSQQKAELTQMLTKFQSSSKTPESIEQFAKDFHQKLIDVFSNKENNTTFALDKNGISPKEHLLSLLKPANAEGAHGQLLQLANSAKDGETPVIQNAFLEADKAVQSSMDSKAMQFALKTVLKSLGLSYEAAIQNSEIEKVAESLKPQLMALMENKEVSDTVKESASTLLARLNGMQLASSEQNHQQQLIMQIPLNFFGKQMDATVQWNGRMKKDGKIDADYARILFYLDMETLKETTIDMQVQNRIVTIQFYNEHTGLDQLAEPFKESLKAGLAELNYHLSGISFKTFQKEGKLVEKKETEVVEHTGVDIRV